MIKKISIIILFILFFFNISSQNVVFKPIFINKCTNKENNYLFWYVKDNKNNIYHRNLYNDYISIRDTGIFFLFIASNLRDSILFESHKTKFTDTFYTNYVYLNHLIQESQNVNYFACDTLCEGYFVDYFYNNKIRLEGNFKNGQPYSIIKTYYRNESLKEIRRYINSNLIIKKTYYPKGNIKQFFSKRRNFNKKYYRNGNKKSLDYYGIFRNRHEKYYQDGNLKSVNYYSFFRKNYKEYEKQVEINIEKPNNK